MGLFDKIKLPKVNIKIPAPELPKNIVSLPSDIDPQSSLGDVLRPAQKALSKVPGAASRTAESLNKKAQDLELPRTDLDVIKDVPTKIGAKAKDTIEQAANVGTKTGRTIAKNTTDTLRSIKKPETMLARKSDFFNDTTAGLLDIVPSTRALTSKIVSQVRVDIDKSALADRDFMKYTVNQSTMNAGHLLRKGAGTVFADGQKFLGGVSSGVKKQAANMGSGVKDQIKNVSNLDMPKNPINKVEFPKIDNPFTQENLESAFKSGGDFFGGVGHEIQKFNPLQKMDKLALVAIGITVLVVAGFLFVMVSKPSIGVKVGV